MSISKGVIAFEFVGDRGRLRVKLKADLEWQSAKKHYWVGNIRAEGSDREVLPPLFICKKQGLWVHSDSEKETDLSVVIGLAIEELEKKAAPQMGKINPAQPRKET